MKPIRIRTFYPADPLGIVPGGIDTFIRGLIKWAPEDLEFSLVGMTTNADSRPAGRWSRCDLGRRHFQFLPVVKVADAGGRTAVPLSLRFSLGTLRYRTQCRADFDVFDFHRLEPALMFAADKRPKNAFFHTDMEVIRTHGQSDILWKRWPTAYFMLEAKIMRSISSVWSVREPATKSLRKRYPFLADQIQFTPTWVDPEVFFPLPPQPRRHARAATEAGLGLDPGAFRVITVGRVDTQKDPALLLSAVEKLIAAGRNIELLYIGDGVLRRELETRVQANGLSRQVRFLGLRSATEIAGLLQACDCFALSSAYEGMPMALLEALGAGTPVVTTPVGEVRRVVANGINGQITEDHSVNALAHCLDQLRLNIADYSTERCVKSVMPFFPEKVLRPVYENYRSLARFTPNA